VPAAGKALDGHFSGNPLHCAGGNAKLDGNLPHAMTGMDGTRRRPYIGLRRWPICNGHVKSPEKLLAINSLGG